MIISKLYKIYCISTQRLCSEYCLYNSACDSGQSSIEHPMQPSMILYGGHHRNQQPSYNCLSDYLSCQCSRLVSHLANLPSILGNYYFVLSAISQLLAKNLWNMRCNRLPVGIESSYTAVYIYKYKLHDPC